MKLTIATSTGLLLLWGLFLLFGISTYVNKIEPEAFGRVLGYHLTKNLPNVQIQFSAARVTFSPDLRIRLTGVNVHHVNDGADMRFTSKELDLSLSLLSLVQGDLQLDSLTLNTPNLALSLTNTIQISDLALTQERINDYLAPMQGLTMRIENGALQINENTSSHTLTLIGLEGDITLPSLSTGDVTLSMGTLLLKKKDANLITLHNLQGDIAELSLPKNTATPLNNAFDLLTLLRGIEANFEASVDDATTKNPLTIAAKFKLAPNTPNTPDTTNTLNLYGSLAAKGGLSLNKHTRDISINIPFQAEITPKTLNASTLNIENAQIAIDSDEATFGGNVSFIQEPRFTGKATIQHFSLPHWFGFARELPENLQHALANISAEMDFILTPKGITVPQLKAISLETTFQGTGQIADFSRPSTHITLHTTTLNLNAFFPELINKKSIPLQYTAPPIISDELAMSKKKSEKGFGKDFVDFDVTIQAKRMEAWTLYAEDFTTRIYNPSEGVRIDYAFKNFYGGVVKGVLDIDDHMQLKLDLQRANARELITAATQEHYGGGLLTVSLDIDGPIASVYQWIASADINAHIELDEGYVMQKRGAQASQRPFQNFTASFQGSGQDSNQNPEQTRKANDTTSPHAFTGQWHASLDTQTWQAQASTNGRISLHVNNLEPIEIQKLPLEFTYSTDSLYGEGISTLSYAREGQTLTLAAITGTMTHNTPDEQAASDTTQFKGHINASNIYTPESLWQGALETDTPQLRAILQVAGMNDLDTYPQKAFRKASVKSDFTYTPESFALDNLQGTIDATNFKGHLSRTMLVDTPKASASDLAEKNAQKLANALADMLVKGQTKKPFWNATLRLDKLDIAQYISKKTPQNETSNTVAALDSFNLQAALRIDELLVSKILLNNVHTAINNTNGSLTLNPLTAEVYTGQLSGAFSLANIEGTNTTLKASLTNLDMLAFSQAQEFKTLTTGSASSDIDFTASIKNPQDFKQSLAGTWRFHIDAGYFANKANDTFKRQFRALDITGIVKNGISQSDDFLITGPSLLVKGHGVTNLPDWTLDYQLHASIPGFPNVPIQVTGSLDKPETDISALETLAGGIGNLGTTVFDSLGNVITSPFRILQNITP